MRGRERREDIEEGRAQAAGNNEGLRGPPHSPFLFFRQAEWKMGEVNRMVVTRIDTSILVTF